MAKDPGNPDQAEMAAMLIKALDGEPEGGGQPERGGSDGEKVSEAEKRALAQLEADDEGGEEAQPGGDDEKGEREEPAKSDGEDDKAVEFQPPEDWDDEGKAFLDKFEDPSDRKHIVDMVNRRVAAAQQMAEQRYAQASDGLRMMETVRQYGIQNPDEVIGKMMRLEVSYDRDPLGTLAGLISEGVRHPKGQQLVGSELAQNFVRQVSQLLGVKSLEAEEPPEFLDPATGQAFSKLEQRLHGIENRFTQQSQAQIEAARQQEVNRIVQEFRASHPHFDQVEKDMAMLLQSGRVQQGDLEGAYNLAVAMNRLQDPSATNGHAAGGANGGQPKGTFRTRTKTTAARAGGGTPQVQSRAADDESWEETMKQAFIKTGAASPSDFY